VLRGRGRRIALDRRRARGDQPFSGRPHTLAVAGVTAAAIGLLVSTTAVGAATRAAVAARPLRASHTVWLCKPGQANDPCLASLASTSVAANGSTTTSPVTPGVSSAAASKFDCFYVYPTVSEQLTPNANLVVQSTERVSALDQASRFSQVCRVWAPMYRQRTVPSLIRIDPRANQVAYLSLLSGWDDYMAHYNHGRPVIFIGHSQGSAILIRLLKAKIDPNPRLRAQMVSAILLGGNVTVPVGKDVGGSFSHIPTCGSARQTGCVIAYSSFGSTPPAASFFGRPGVGVSSLSGQTATQNLQVVCVNPANFSSAPAPIVPYFLSAASFTPGVPVQTPWVTYPGLYTGQCQTADGATSLQVIPTGVTGDPRPLVLASLGPNWGYHINDVNLTLGNLVSDVAAEEGAYRR
jgi:Protein of unknown function (DUF3089)